MQVHYDTTTRVFYLSHSLDSPPPLGFFENPQTHRFETSSLRAAATLRDDHASEVKSMFDKISCRILEPWRGGISIPKAKPLDQFQRQGVLHAMERNNSYLAFEQGMGKTPTAIAVINTYARAAFILLPPHLVHKWKREIETWQTKPYKIGVIENGKTLGPGDYDIVLCPDSIIQPGSCLDFVGPCKDGLLIVEEAQRFCNHTSIRTKALFGMPHMIPDGLMHQFSKVVFLSGTPMPNRPVELYPILSSAAANLINFRTKDEYGVRYCAAYSNGFGMDYRGASNLEELHDRIHNVFIRREEKEAGQHFTKKQRQIVYLDASAPSPRVKKMEEMTLKGRSIKEFCKAWRAGEIASKKDLAQISAYRKAVGEKKIGFCAQHVTDIMETTKESVLVFGWHIDYINRLYLKLAPYHPFIVSGQISFKEREKRIKAFQEGRTRLLIANIETMVGYDIEKASRGVFFEYMWTPGKNEQAEDRLHRRTSKQDVLIEYLCLSNTIDEYMLDSILKKNKVIQTVIGKSG